MRIGPFHIPFTASSKTASAPAARPKIASAPAKSWSQPMSGEWTLDKHGVKSDPVSIYVHGSLADVEARLKSGGWTQAKKSSLHENAEYVGAVPLEGADVAANKGLGLFDRLVTKLTGRPDNEQLIDPFKGTVQSMPVSPQTYNGSPLVVGYEKNNNPLGGRDHLRIFDTGAVDAQGKHVWAIAASRDTGIKIDKHRPEQGFLNHAVAPVTDPERDLVLRALRSGPLKVDTLSLDFGSTAAPATGELPRDKKVYDVEL